MAYFELRFFDLMSDNGRVFNEDISGKHLQPDSYIEGEEREWDTWKSNRDAIADHYLEQERLP